MTDANALPPETLEGWYALHQIFSVDHTALRAYDPAAWRTARCAAADTIAELAMADEGWSAVAELVGSTGHVMFMHLRPTLDALGDIQRRLARLQAMDVLRPTFNFLSVTEVGLYQLAAHGADDPKKAERIQAEKESAHVQRRLYPSLPADMPYVSFYPMSKRRDTGQNWYTLSLPDRSRLMQSHGLTGRRYAGRVLQIITGAIGFNTWEWGVTLFAKNPLEFKKLVTEMRFDEASAKYADFGEFFVGTVVQPSKWLESLAP
jgi:hydrogen peroxide-dependent heme synthase